MRPVVWSIEAQRDSLEILRYIAEDNPFVTERVVDAIEDAGNELGEFATGRPGRVSGTYEKPVKAFPCIIAYAIAGPSGRAEQIAILRLIHTSRDWPSEGWPA